MVGKVSGPFDDSVVSDREGNASAVRGRQQMNGCSELVSGNAVARWRGVGRALLKGLVPDERIGSGRPRNCVRQPNGKTCSDIIMADATDVGPAIIVTVELIRTW